MHNVCLVFCLYVMLIENVSYSIVSSLHNMFISLIYKSVRDFHGSNLEFISSFVTAASLLSGLLLYDVFWVFGSSHVFGDNVMVTVSIN